MLMPAAAAQFAKEEPQLERARKENACDANLIPLIARNAEEALVAEVVGNLTEEQDNALLPGMQALFPKIHVLIPKIRVIVNIDPAGHFKPDEKYGLEIFDSNTGRRVTDVPAEARPGNRFIVLAQSGSSANTLAVERCGIVPMMPANLALVQNAIAGNLPPAKP